MKVFVTGGAGFIASHIVDTYIAAGHEVVVIDNLNDHYDVSLKQARLAQLEAFRVTSHESRNVGISLSRNSTSPIARRWSRCSAVVIARTEPEALPMFPSTVSCTRQPRRACATRSKIRTPIFRQTSWAS